MLHLIFLIWTTALRGPYYSLMLYYNGDFPILQEDLRDFPNRNLLFIFCSFSADVSLCTGSEKIIPPG